MGIFAYLYPTLRDADAKKRSGSHFLFWKYDRSHAITRLRFFLL